MTDTVKIDADRAIKLVREAVAQRGKDFVYVPPLSEGEPIDEYHGPFAGECVYVHNGEPSCLIGLALHLAGVPLENLSILEGHTASSAAPSRFGFPPSHPVPGLELTREAGQIFDRAQNKQDNGGPYREALAEAKYEYDYQKKAA